MKKNKVKMIAVFAILLLAVAGAYFGLSSLSIVGENVEQTYPEASCEQPQDCYNYFIANGFPQSDLDEQLKTLKFTCERNICGVASK